MKPTRYPLTLFIALSLFSFQTLCAQMNDAGAYMATINEKQRQILEESLGYISAVAHGKSARKIDKRRTELVNAILQAKATAKNMKPFEGDTSLRSSAFNFFSLNYIVIKEDYGKIVDLEEISEQSYDNMEAYIMAQDQANNKLSEAWDKMDREFKAFAAAHNIKLIEEENKVSRMAEQVDRVNKYYHEIYLIFFKSYKQELYLSEAIEKKDINGIEQNKNSLLKTTEEGLAKLAKISAFDEDADLLTACRELLRFYQSEAKNKISIVTDFLLKNENFEKLKKAMDAKSDSQRTQKDVDSFNAAVKEINTAVGIYNKTNQEINNSRTKLIDGWNNAVENFMNKHTPRYRK